MKPRNIFVILIVAVLTQSCLRGVGSNAPSALPTALEGVPVSTEIQSAPSSTPTTQVDTPVPTATMIIPTETLLPTVTISAEKGNLYIRRGPGVAYDRIGLLSKGTSADVIARDVLSKWVQVNIPDSDKTGWVSLLTEYSKLDGDLSAVPDFTFSEWPVAAYLFNCTEHDIYIMPGEIVVTSYFTHPNNQAWLNPGVYTVYDYTMPSRPKLKDVDIREGLDVAILYDGLGNHHKCP
jgi:hypothetical protein